MDSTSAMCPNAWKHSRKVPEIFSNFFFDFLLAPWTDIHYFLDHIVEHHDGGLQWLDHEFCSAVYRQAVATKSLELLELFKTLDKLTETARTSGKEWLEEFEVQKLVDAKHTGSILKLWRHFLHLWRHNFKINQKTTLTTCPICSLKKLVSI